MKETNEMKLDAIESTPKYGTEFLTYNEVSVGYSLFEFWQWSVSDILSNSTRGKFAEFIVGTAVNLDPRQLRAEWDAYDISTAEGIKIEVKSAAYIQSWKQEKFSSISFSIKKARYWDAISGTSRGEARRHADLYVFCLLKTKDQSIIDPLKLEQWEFYVLPTYKLDVYKGDQNTITIKSLQQLTASVAYNELRVMIENCYLDHCENVK